MTKISNKTEGCWDMSQFDQKGMKFPGLSSRKYLNFPFPSVTWRKCRQALHNTTVNVLCMSHLFDQIFFLLATLFYLQQQSFRLAWEAWNDRLHEITISQKSLLNRYLCWRLKTKKSKVWEGCGTPQTWKIPQMSIAPHKYVSIPWPPHHSAESEARGSSREGVTFPYSPSHMSSAGEGVGNSNTELIYERTLKTPWDQHPSVWMNR